VDLQEKDLKAYFESLREIGYNLNKDKESNTYVKFFNAVGNEVRLNIVKLLNEKEYCVCELEAILDKPQSSISHHLKILEKTGLIRGIKKGYFTHYELIKKQFQEHLRRFNELYNF
jgi:ArsR family transcriptional regulator